MKSLSLALVVGALAVAASPLRSKHAPRRGPRVPRALMAPDGILSREVRGTGAHVRASIKVTDPGDGGDGGAGGSRPTSAPRAHFKDAYRALFPDDATDTPPLILTDYLHDPARAQALSSTVLPITDGKTFVGNAGFFEVDKRFGSTMFFWLTPPVIGENAPPHTPTCLALWLQGGPGSSSLFGLFAENGPVRVNPTADGLNEQAGSWTSVCDMVYIDNPVGTGFSFARDTAGIPTNETKVGEDLYEMLSQFFTVFPHYQQLPFYIAGESYAGHYCPAIAAKIVAENAAGATPHINLQGVAIGDGLVELETQIQGYSQIVQGTGLAEGSQLTQIKALQDAGAVYMGGFFKKLNLSG
jgi:hypothetical protein